MTDDRCIALYPGAFRPPHADHYEVVRHLAERSDVDEVVVIVSNRNRDVPGTTKTIGVELARAVWSLYLRNLPHVRVELASRSAIRHALDRIDHAPPGTHFLLVVGEKDFNRRRARFDGIGNRPDGARATLVRGATNVVNVSATDLREALAEGEPARAVFYSALPPHLSATEKRHVWSMCRNAMRDRDDTRSELVAAWLLDQGIGVALGVEPVRRGKRDEVYRAELRDGSRVFVKTANDTVSTARIGDADGPKPRARLKAEYAALKYIRTHVTDPVDIPTVLRFDRATRTIAFAELCPFGNSLQDDLRHGQFERPVARRLASFLADSHTARPSPEPFRDSPEKDLEHWRDMLRITTAAGNAACRNPKVVAALDRLRGASDAARTAGFVHLDLQPKNVYVSARDVGVLDFECAASVGDPAVDTGQLLGAYLQAGLRSGAGTACRSAIEAFMLCYAAGVHGRWTRMSGRVLGFAGATLLRDKVDENETLIERKRVVAHAHRLLEQSGGEPLVCSDRLCALLPHARSATPRGIPG